MVRTFLVRLLPLALLVSLTPGCGNSTASVSGEVTYNGEPVGDGYITFLPADGKGPSGAGPIEGGHFTVDNLTPGPKVVKVEADKKVPFACVLYRMCRRLASLGYTEPPRHWIGHDELHLVQSPAQLIARSCFEPAAAAAYAEQRAGREQNIHDRLGVGGIVFEASWRILPEIDDTNATFAQYDLTSRFVDIRARGTRQLLPASRKVPSEVHLLF